MVEETESGSSVDERVGRNIEELRKERSWSQSELARRIQALGFDKFNQMTVSRTEKGERTISVRELMAFGEVFDAQLYHVLNAKPARTVSEIAAALEDARRAAEDALARVDELRSDLAYAAEGVDWSDRRMPPYAAGVEADIRQTVRDLVDLYVAKRNVRSRDELEIPRELQRLRGGEPSAVGAAPDPQGRYPFLDALEEADDGVDQEA